MVTYSKTKILLIGHGLGEGGGDRYIFEQAYLLLKCGYHVECIAFIGGELASLYEQHNISYTIYPISELNISKIHDLVKNFDFIIANTMYTIFFAFEAQKYKPTMLILHESIGYMKNLILRTSYTLEELRQIRHLYCVSKYQADTLTELGLKNIRILNNFVGDRFIAPCKKNDQKVKFLTVANWNMVKGYDLALDAFSSLSSNEKEQIEWHIVGKMDIGKENMDFRLQAEMEQWIVFHGAITDREYLYNFYCESDVYLHLSREDSSPLAVIDAAMMNIPMIVSKDTGSNYLAQNGAGWIVDEYDCKNSSAAIRSALNKKDQLKDMGRKARINYLTNATPEIYSKLLVKEIQRVEEADTNEAISNNIYTKQQVVRKPHSSIQIALYGYNMYAQIEGFYHKKYDLYELIGIYDKNYKKYKNKQLEIKDPEALNSECYNFICICCSSPSTILLIQEYLISMGISKMKIHVGINSIPEFANN